MTPEQLAKSGSEHSHQTALFCWASQNFDTYPDLRWMFAIPNGGERNKAVAANLKAEGVRAGVPDIFLPVPRGAWHGLYIEMKIKPNTVGTEQKKWIQALRDLNYGAVVCWSWEEARDTIVAYLSWQ